MVRKERNSRQRKSKNRSIRRRIRSQRGNGAKCSEVPILKFAVNNPGINCYRVYERATMNSYIERYNPRNSRYIEEFLRFNSHLWELRDDLKGNSEMADIFRRINDMTSSDTLRWKLFDLIGGTFAMNELKSLKLRYLDKLDVVNKEVDTAFSRRYKELDKAHQGVIQYLKKR